VFVLALFTGAAGVNPPAPPPGQNGPCVPDVQKFCPNVPIGEGRRIACLAKHQSQLAPLCQKRLPVLQAMFEYGQQQKKKTEEYLAKQAAEEAAKHPKPNQQPSKQPSPPPPAKPK
jgi:hypothetical protein